MPGCMLRIAAEGTQLVAGTGSSVTITLPLPADPQLLGVVYFLQGFALAPGTNPAGALATPSYRGVVGQWR